MLVFFGGSGVFIGVEIIKFFSESFGWIGDIILLLLSVINSFILLSDALFLGDGVSIESAGLFIGSLIEGGGVGGGVGDNRGISSSLLLLLLLFTILSLSSSSS